MQLLDNDDGEENPGQCDSCREHSLINAFCPQVKLFDGPYPALDDLTFTRWYSQEEKAAQYAVGWYV